MGSLIPILDIANTRLSMNLCLCVCVRALDGNWKQFRPRS